MDYSMTPPPLDDGPPPVDDENETGEIVAVGGAVKILDLSDSASSREITPAPAPSFSLSPETSHTPPHPARPRIDGDSLLDEIEDTLNVHLPTPSSSSLSERIEPPPAVQIDSIIQTNTQHDPIATVSTAASQPPDNDNNDHDAHPPESLSSCRKNDSEDPEVCQTLDNYEIRPDSDGSIRRTDEIPDSDELELRPPPPSDIIPCSSSSATENDDDADDGCPAENETPSKERNADENDSQPEESKSPEGGIHTAVCTANEPEETVDSQSLFQNESLKPMVTSENIDDHPPPNDDHEITVIEEEKYEGEGQSVILIQDSSSHQSDTVGDSDDDDDEFGDFGDFNAAFSSQPAPAYNGGGEQAGIVVKEPNKQDDDVDDGDWNAFGGGTGGGFDTKDDENGQGDDGGSWASFSFPIDNRDGTLNDANDEKFNWAGGGGMPSNTTIKAKTTTDQSNSTTEMPAGSRAELSFGDDDEDQLFVSSDPSSQPTPIPTHQNSSLAGLSSVYSDGTLIEWQNSFIINQDVYRLPTNNSLINNGGGGLWWVIDEKHWTDAHQPTVELQVDNDQKEDNKSQENNHHSRDNEFWTSVRKMEEAEGLSFQWNAAATAYMLYMKSLNMDYAQAKMSGNPKLPVFASQLGAVQLAPTPVQQPLTSATLTPTSENPQSATLKPSTATPSSVQGESGRHHHEAGSLQSHSRTAAAAATTSNTSSAAATTSTSKPKQDEINSLNVPPVEFSWSDSGLTNPLSGGATANSAILDLDFISTNQVISAKSVLEADLEKLGLNDDDSGGVVGCDTTNTNKRINNDNPVTNNHNKPGGGGGNGKQPGSNGANNGKTRLIESVMKGDAGRSTTDSRNNSTSSNPSTTKPPPGVTSLSVNSLSVEAQSIVSQLPDLSYMLKDVLMFPIRNRQDQS